MQEMFLSFGQHLYLLRTATHTNTSKLHCTSTQAFSHSTPYMQEMFLSFGQHLCLLRTATHTNKSNLHCTSTQAFSHSTPYMQEIFLSFGQHLCLLRTATLIPAVLSCFTAPSRILCVTWRARSSVTSCMHLAGPRLMAVDT